MLGSMIFSFACNADEFDGVKLEMLIGLIPEQNIFIQMEKYMPLAEYLSNRLGKEIKLTILSKYGDVIDRFYSRGMDGAFLGELTAVIAYEKLGVRPIATMINLDDSDRVRGHIIARRDSGIHSINDMKGRVAAFVDKASVTGYLFPLAYLKKNGIDDPENFFSEIFFTGSNDASVFAVLDGRADIGCVNNRVLRDIIANDAMIGKELAIIATSDEMPNTTLCVNRNLAPDDQKAIRKILVDIENDEKGKEVMKVFGARGFREATIKDFAPVYALLKEIRINVKRYNYVIK